MTARKIIKSTAISATLLTSVLAAAIGNAASGPEWLAEQRSLSDGSSYFAQEGARQGAEGRPAVAQASERDSFLEAQRAISDGSPYAAESGAGKGPEGKRADPSNGAQTAFVERQLRITDGAAD